MKKSGDVWLPDLDTYFSPYFDSGQGFQLDRLDTALSFLDPNRFGIAVDGGAHVGSWTKVLAGCFKKVLAFEPAADTFDCLCQNTRNLPNVYQFNQPLGDKERRVKIVDDITREGNTGSRYIQDVDAHEVVSITRTSTTVTIDSLVLSGLDFLKLDVEGAELLALKGARDTILKYKPVIFIESKKGMAERFGGYTGDALEFLRNLGAAEVAKIKSDYVYMFK